MAEVNPFDAHTALIEEAREKTFYVLGDLNLMGKPTSKRPPLPKNELALLEAIASCKALSATSRQRVRDAIAVLPEIDAAMKAATPDVRRQIDAGCAIIYASQSRGDLDRGLRLITELFSTESAAIGVQAVRDMIRSGEGRIYGTARQPLIDPGYGKTLPKAVYSSRSTLKIDAAAAFGAVIAGKLNPWVIAGAAAAASLVASFKDVLDWMFPEDVPLFPGGTGPYNPYPNPNPA